MTTARERPFERRWTDEQRAAIVFAMLDRQPKLSAAKAAAAGTRGELVGPNGKLPPFGKERLPDGSWTPMPTATAHDFARKERAARNVQANGRLAKAENASTAVRMVLASAWDELDKAREGARRAKNVKPADRARVQREIIATARDIYRLEAEVTGERPSKSKPPAPEPEKRNGEAAALTRAARSRARAEHPEDPAATARSSATAGSTADGETARVTDSVARERAKPVLERDRGVMSAARIAQEARIAAGNGSSA